MHIFLYSSSFHLQFSINFLIRIHLFLLRIIINDVFYQSFSSVIHVWTYNSNKGMSKDCLVNSLTLLLKIQGYKSFQDFLINYKQSTTVTKTMKESKDLTSVTTIPSTYVETNDKSVEWFRIIEILLGCLGTFFSGTGCYCLFKCWRNSWKCKVKFHLRW